jgi:trimethylamine--corrinoid protein Co-methyltransferase
VRFEALTEREKTTIHQAALGILEEVGLHVPPASTLAGRLREVGLKVTPEGRLHLPRSVVEAALAKAPRVVRLGGRDGRETAVLDGRRTFITTDGCGAWTIDPDTGERRASILSDVARSARLTDALEHYQVYWMMVSAGDAPLPLRTAREYLTAAQNTTKHVQMIDVHRPEEAAAIVRMARALQDTGAAIDPPVSMLNSVVSPLRLDPGGCEAALAFAAAGLPVAACSMPIASVTAPATAPGSLLMSHTEIVGFTAIVQTFHPGAPVIYTGFPAFADARTGITNYRDPRRWWAAAAATQMGQSVRLPVFTSGELASLLERPDMLCFGGLLEVSTVLSFEQLVIDHEIVRDMLLSAAPQPVDDETLGVEVVREVGPGGHFLSRRHTMRHIREFVVPKFSEPSRPVEPADETAAPEEAPGALARREALRLIATHTVPAIEARAAAAMERLAT